MRNKSKETPDIDKFAHILRSRGMKATPQRLAVHEAMLELGHACADNVVEKIRERGETRVTVASVYNILSDLADARIYHRRMSANNKMYFDVNTFKHIHLYNTRDNEFSDVIDDKLVEEVESHLKGRRFKGYKIDAVDIQIICHPTRKQRPDTL